MAEKRIRRIITSVFDRNAARKVEGEMVRSMESAGQRGGENFMRELRGRFNSRIATLREDLARGIIDKGEFKKQSDAAAKAFNEGLLASIQKARAEGRMTDQEYVKLTRNLKRTGDQGASTWERIRGGIVKAAAAAMAFVGARALFQFGRDSIRMAEEVEKGQRALEQQLANVGVTWASVRGEVQRTTRALWDTHRLTGGEITQILRQLIVVTGDYETSLRAVGTVQDIAAATGLGMEQAARLLGRAIKGETTVFRRYGLEIDATRDVLEQLDQRFGGAAKAGTTSAEALRKAWGDFKEELGRVLTDVSRGPSLMDRLTGAVRWATENMDALVASALNLGKAIVLVSSAAVLGRLVVALRAANVATATFAATLKGTYALLGPKGWFILGVAALTTWFQKSGSAAREAAREAQEAAEDFKKALGEMDDAALEARAGANRDRLRRLDQGIANDEARIARRKALVEEMEAGFEKRSMLGEIQTIEGRVERLRAEKARVMADHAETLRTIGGRGAVAPEEGGGGGPEGGASPARDEIGFLKQGHDLRVLTREESARAFQMALDTRAELQRANLTLEQRIALVQRLQALEGITGERAIAPSVTDGTTGDLGDGKIVTTARLPPPPEQNVSAWHTALSDLASHSSTTAMYMERSFGQFFTAIGTGFDTTKDGFHSLADAAAGIGGSIVAGLAGGMRDYHLAQGAGKLAEGIWPPNPAALASAAKHIAAAGLFGALEGVAGNAGQRRGVSAPMGAPGEMGRSAVDSMERQGAEINLFINPWDPSNPLMQDSVYAAQQYASERWGPNARVTTRPYSRGGR